MIVDFLFIDQRKIRFALIKNLQHTPNKRVSKKLKPKWLYQRPVSLLQYIGIVTFR